MPVMSDWKRCSGFLEALAIAQNEVVCFSGAGGKTSLIFAVAAEAKERGWRVLVTTTTKMFLPLATQCDRLDLSGKVPAGDTRSLVVGGRKSGVAGKFEGYAFDTLTEAQKCFDLILIEADGAAMKPLKGWKETEPVIPEFAGVTVGVVDISTVGCEIVAPRIHRLPLFLELTGALEGSQLELCHLQRMIEGEKGLFQHSRGRQVVFLNKMETGKTMADGVSLRHQLGKLCCVGGSVHDGVAYG